MAAIELGVMIFPTDLTIGPAALAREAEARGFESLWFPEHTHIPVSRTTPWPGGEPLPDHYRRTLDPFVALAAASGVTERLKLGTGICLVAQHDPIVLAKTIASLDFASDGRFLFGIGVGWNVDEMQQHGVEPSQRRDVVREKVLAMQQLWTQEAGSFEGEHVRFAPSWSWPKPVGKPPVIMGGAGGPVTFRHVAGVLRRLDADPRPARRPVQARPAPRGLRGSRSRSVHPSSSACSACRASPTSSRTTPPTASPASCWAAPGRRRRGAAGARQLRAVARDAVRALLGRP